MDKLYGLSIEQPWLDMILRGVKSMVIRSWKVRRRGLVALHAARRIDFSAAYFYGYEKPWTLPRGGIIAVAEITNGYTLKDSLWFKFLEKHRQPFPVADGAYGLLLANIRALDRPVRCRGYPMLFELHKGTAERVRQAARLPKEGN
jgi:hypothetical protein